MNKQGHHDPVSVFILVAVFGTVIILVLLGLFVPDWLIDG